MTAVIGGVVISMTGLAVFVLGLRVRQKWFRAAGLMQVLVGFFVAFAALLAGMGPETPRWLPAAALAGAVAVFRLMAAFEPPAPEQ